VLLVDFVNIHELNKLLKFYVTVNINWCQKIIFLNKLIFFGFTIFVFLPDKLFVRNEELFPILLQLLLIFLFIFIPSLIPCAEKGGKFFLSCV